MKNQTKNTNKIGENTSTRNFFQKTFILLAILAFTSFGFKVKAQNFTIDIYNTSSCTGWDIEVYDNAPTPNLVTTYYNVSTGLTSCFPSTIGYIIVKKASCFYSGTFGSAGSFPYTSSTFSCCGGSRTVTCTGGSGNGSCGSGDTGDVTLLVEIKQ